MRELNVGQVIICKQGESSKNYQDFSSVVKEKNIKVKFVSKGDRVIIEKDLFFDVLWPESNGYITENSLNNNSIVCKLYYNNFSMLFTGDIEEIAEKKILYEYKNNLEKLHSIVLKVGHHGSKTSSTKEFLEAIKPQIALIGVGKNNIFGHPNEQIIERLQENKVKIFRTDHSGELTLEIDRKGKFIIKTYK